MDKLQEVKQICREVFADTVKHACGIHIEQSNQSSAAMIRFYEKSSNVFRSNISVTIGDAIEGFIMNISAQPIDSWKCVRLIYCTLYIHASFLIERPAFDDARVISLTKEHCLQPVLNLVVPWIVSREGGWEDLRQSSIWNSEIHAIEWDHRQANKKPLVLLLVGIRKLTNAL